MDKNKKKLFEAFEKVCGIKLLNEQDIVIGEVESLKEYMLENLSLDLQLVTGSKRFDNIDFDFELNNKKYTGIISLIVESRLDPLSDQITVEDVNIKNLNVGDEDTDIIVFDKDIQNHIDFVEQLEGKLTETDRIY